MRSVVVVFPASMCAMMPMLRVRWSALAPPWVLWVLSSTAMIVPYGSQNCEVRSEKAGHPRRSPSPLVFLTSHFSPLTSLESVVREGLVGVGHAVRILAPLDRGAGVVGGVEHLGGELLGHRAAGARAGGAEQPADRQGEAPVALDRHRDLVGRAADALRLDLDHRRGVADRLLEDVERLAPGPRVDQLQRAVEDALGRALLAALHDLVDQLGDQHALVAWVGQQLSL